MCIPNTALNNFSKLTETSVQRSPNDGIVNGPLQKGSLTILLSMSIFLVRKRKSLTAVFCQSVHILCNLLVGDLGIDLRAGNRRMPHHLSDALDRNYRL